MKTVYVAWGFQGEFFSVHATHASALEFIKKEYSDNGGDPDEVTGEEGILDGFFVEEYPVWES
jgi:hypothetical protein